MISSISHHLHQRSRWLATVLPPVAWGAGAALRLLLGPPGAPDALALGVGAGALALLSLEPPRWLSTARIVAAVSALVLAALGPFPVWPPLLAGILTALAAGLDLADRQRHQVECDHRLQETAGQLDRRISELFSLQELGYLLAESLQSDRIAGQLTNYVIRFLGVEGAAVALRPGGEALGRLEVVAADGSLMSARGLLLARSEEGGDSLAERAAASERLEFSRATGGGTVQPLPGHLATTGAAVPLRAHGLMLGVLVVAGRRDRRELALEDLRLLSTVATHAAVVIANSRLFELVRRGRDEWETAFNAIAEGVAVLDAEGKIVRGNAALARLLDQPASALVGCRFWDTVVGDLEGESDLVGTAREGARPPRRTIVSPALQRTLRLMAAPLAGEGAAVVVLVEDVTEQRALETQLLQSERLAAVGQLVSGVAHELNNPLTSIAGLAEFLAGRLTDQTERDHLLVIREQADRAGRIIRNLLTFARRGGAGRGIVDLADVATRTGVLVGYEVRFHGIEFVERVAAGPLPVRGNRDELEQVLINLITNAVQSVRALPPESRRWVALETEAVAGGVMVRVGDTGPGVPEALVPHLFTPFFTTKEPGEGTGLGLSLSYRIVEAHGGRLEYRRREDGGAEFRFTLPLAGGAPLEPGEAEPGAARDRAVLVVDPDPHAEVVARALLEPAGYSVEVARTAAEGALRLGARAWRAVLLDAGLSADGRQLLLDTVPANQATTLIAATADPALATRVRALGGVVIPRPFLPRDLAQALPELLAT